MNEKLPVNNEILRWARTSLNLTIEEVSKRINKSVDLIIDWEKGISSPTYPQLEKLAYEIYKRPVALFFFPEVPDIATPTMDLRTLPDTIIDDLPKEIIMLYRKAKTQQINLEELYEGNFPVGNSIVESFSLNFKDDVVELSKQVRKALNVSIEEQFGWKKMEEAFEKWRNALEERGVFVFKDAFHNNDYSGFCIYHEKYPVIYVNNSMSFSRQIFTLFHELGHLFEKSGGIDFRAGSIFDSMTQEYQKIEQKCNEFAGEFLIPRNTLTVEEMEINESAIGNLATKFSVSREVVLRKYMNYQLIDSQFYQKMVQKWEDDFRNRTVKTAAKGGGNYYYTQRVYLGQKYIRLAFSKYYQNKISMDSLANYFGMKVKNISTFEHLAFS